MDECEEGRIDEVDLVSQEKRQSRRSKPVFLYTINVKAVYGLPEQNAHITCAARRSKKAYTSIYSTRDQLGDIAAPELRMGCDCAHTEGLASVRGKQAPGV